MQQSLIYGVIIKHAVVVISREIEYYTLQTKTYRGISSCDCVFTSKEKMGVITPTFIKGKNNDKNGGKVIFEDKSCEYIKHLYYYTFLTEHLSRS